ncbi:MAG TPA: hypothetical protein P5572_04815 [Phycisphaerae bacterium]|nr:hypothetical protein [Phycisphaerae bacterium]
MKKAKRIRYTLMCASIMCCVALACGWLATLRWSIRYVDNVRRFQVGLAAGGVNLFVAQGRDMTAPRTKAREWHVITDRPYILDERGWLVQVCWREYPWLPRYVNAAQRVWLHLPLLWPLLLMTTISMVLYRSVRRRVPGCCPQCGYDLHGNISGLCPECGASA